MAAAAVVALGAGWFAWLRAARHVGPWLEILGRAPQRTTVEAGEGLVRIEGMARGEPTLQSAVHREACLAYVARIDEWVGTGKNGKWVERWRESQSVSFDLVDGVGAARIETDGGVKLDFGREGDVRGRNRDEALPGHVQALVEKAGIDPSRRARALEWRLDAGEPCTVIGRARRVADAGGLASYREAPTRLVLDAGPERLWIADRRGASLLRSLRLRLHVRAAATAVFVFAAGALLIWQHFQHVARRHG